MMRQDKLREIKAKLSVIRRNWIEGSVWLWAGPLLFMLLISIYFLVRFEGHWAETDSAAFTHYIREVADQGRLIPVSRDIYPNGYAYQAISTFVLSMTGLQVEVLQQWIYPLLAALVVLPAWVMYREFTGSNYGAAIITMLLFTQPEFLFVILRSSHEKFTRALMMLCLFLLVRSYNLKDQPGKSTVYLILSYIVSFSMITSNNLLANSFFLAIAFACLLGWILTKINPALKQYTYILKYLFYSTLVFFALSAIFTYYVYPPALHNLSVFDDVKSRILNLFVEVDAPSATTYTQVSTAWVNLPIYFLLSIANWIVLGVSLLIWLWQAFLFLGVFRVPKTQAAWLLWLLYAAFSVLGGLAALVDVSGALASNLQHRIFPSFSMIAVGVIGLAILDWRPRRFSREIAIGLTASVFVLSLLSTFKATNEPLLSNKWNFYHPNEIAAMRWVNRHLVNTDIWTEFDERLSVVYGTLYDDSQNQFKPDPSTAVRNILVTNITRLRSSRIHQILPVPPDALQVYDNGFAQLFHLQPQTPFQR